MTNPTHILLMLADGARAAEDHGEHGLAETLTAMTRSLAESLAHANDGHGFRQWRQEDLREILEAIR